MSCKLLVTVVKHHIVYAGVRGDGQGGKGDPRLQLVGVARDASGTKGDDECRAGNKVKNKNSFFELKKTTKNVREREKKTRIPHVRQITIYVRVSIYR